MASLEQALDARSADLVSRLSVADKIAALYGGQWGKYGPGMGGPAFPSVGIAQGYNWWSEAAHGIWFVRWNDQIPYASNAVLPITSSCSFNRSLWSATGNQIGREGRAFTNIQEGDSTFWAPVINIVRDPRWGRNLETAGEDPFLSGDSASLPGIRANETREVALQGAETAVELPEAFRQGNVLVAANSGSTRVLKVLDSKALEIVRQPAERTLQVFDSATRLPLPRSYVKVYTQGRDGEAVFHKDGYTDLRGKFDYLSHTGSTLGEIRRIAVLISHPEKGARIEIFDL